MMTTARDYPSRVRARRVGVPAAGAMLAVGAGLALGACGSSGPAVGSRTLYGPSGGQFSAAFPSSPGVLHLPASQETGLPPGSSTTVYGVGDLQSKSGAPKAPTYAVSVTFLAGSGGAARSAELLAGFEQQLARQKGVTVRNVTFGSARGFEAFGSELALTGGDNGDARARAGMALVVRGATIYLAGAFADSASSVESFIASFRPA
jgi:hypothetical protein